GVTGQHLVKLDGSVGFRYGCHHFILSQCMGMVESEPVGVTSTYGLTITCWPLALPLLPLRVSAPALRTQASCRTPWSPCCTGHLLSVCAASSSSPFV